VERLSPFGMGNPTPMFGVRGVRPVGRARLVGRNHLKMVLGDGETSMEAIGFDMADRGMPDGPVDVLFHLKENTYGGRTTLQMHIKDFRSAQAEA
jgi:single-stranded-DNA-specific exonuclease